MARDAKETADSLAAACRSCARGEGGDDLLKRRWEQGGLRDDVDAFHQRWERGVVAARPAMPLGEANRMME